MLSREFPPVLQFVSTGLMGLTGLLPEGDDRSSRGQVLVNELPTGLVDWVSVISGLSWARESAGTVSCFLCWVQGPCFLVRFNDPVRDVNGGDVRGRMNECQSIPNFGPGFKGPCG